VPTSFCQDIGDSPALATCLGEPLFGALSEGGVDAFTVEAMLAALPPLFSNGDKSPDEAESTQSDSEGVADDAKWRPSSTWRVDNLEEPFSSSQKLRMLPCGNVVTDSSSREKMEPELSHSLFSHEFVAWPEGKPNEFDVSSSQLLLLIKSPVYIEFEDCAKVLAVGPHAFLILSLPRDA
jgi:hypothetical protein